jgi:hypothetical protein
MSEITFVNQLGDAIERVASAAVVPARRRRLVARRRRAALVLVVLATGGVATAATLLSSPSPTTLAASSITCYGSTTLGANMYADVEANGLNPVQACRDLFAKDGPAALGAPGARLLACVKSGLGVVVLASDGDVRQCSADGMLPFAGGSYAVAQSSVDALVGGLTALGANRACVPTQSLIAQVDGVLARLGWRGWRAQRQTLGGQSSSGACGLFLGTGASFSDPTASLDPQRQVVWVTSGPDPTVLALTGPLDTRLMQATGRGCYTTDAAKTLVLGAVAYARLSVTFDLTQEPTGLQSGYAQSSYDNGCTIVGSLQAAAVGRALTVLLYAKSGPGAGAGTGAAPGPVAATGTTAAPGPVAATGTTAAPGTSP